MSKHQITNILFIAGIFYIFYADFTEGIDSLVYIFYGIIYLLILFFGVVFTQFNFFVDHELAGDARFNEISLSFDDGPNEEYTEKILAKLDEYGIKASFFVIGANAEKNKDLVKKIYEQGHIIGNHSYTHRKSIESRKVKTIIAEIDRTNTVIKDIIGKKPLYFRPPFGLTTPRVAKAIEQTNMVPVAWSLRTYDTKITTEKVIKKIRKRLNGGDIVLLHDNHEGILEILDFLIPYAHETGFKFVSMDQLLDKKAYE